MIEQTAMNYSADEVFAETDKGESVQFDMTLPLQILFDDVFNFVSKTDFEY